MLEHEDAVRHPDAERASGHPLPDDRRDDGHPQPGHLAEVERDGLPDAALLGADARVGARSVDEADDGAAELLRLMHEPERFAVAFRVRHPEVTAQVLLHVPALLLADDHDGAPVQACPPAYDGLVVAEVPVAVELHPVGEDALHVIERERPPRMTRDLDLLDGLQGVVRLALELAELPAQHIDFVGYVDAFAVRQIEQLVDLRLDLDDVSLEV